MSIAQVKAARHKIKHDPRYRKGRDPEAAKRREQDRKNKAAAMMARSSKKN